MFLIFGCLKKGTPFHRFFFGRIFRRIREIWFLEKSVEKSVENENPSKNPTNSTGFQTINFENAEDFPARTSDVIIRQTVLSIPGAFWSDFLLKNNDFQ